MINKKILSLLLALALIACPLVSMAAAENLPKDYNGTVNYIVDIKNPESVISSTTSKTCVISASAVCGTKITLYQLNTATDKYEKMYIDGKALEATVGQSNMYAQSIELKNGLNSIMVVASANGEAFETVKLEITLLRSSVSNNVKSLWQSLLSY